MVLIEDSLSVVLVGDWNKLYIQPDWMAQHIFEKKELEIGVNGQGSEFSVLYRGNGIIVTPGRDKMVFSAINMDSDTIGNLCKCLNNFIEKAFTTQLYAYGLNIDFIEDGGTVFAEVLDSMADTNAIIESGYEVIATRISRTLRNRDKIVNMDSSLEDSRLKVHFNEHHSEIEDKPDFDLTYIREFIDGCREFLCGLGYEMEENEP